MKNKRLQKSKIKVMLRQGALISGVAAGSPAEQMGIRPGDRLLRLDSRAIGDIIDYKILEADDKLRLLLRTGSGRLKRVAVQKAPETTLGLQFEPPTIAPLKRCGNRCLFCFIKQNPRGLRRSLYLKDDDYRLSFLYGNFITLNNLGEKEMQRIIKLRLSPLYVSVHATDPTVRLGLFGTDLAKRGLNNLYKLAAAGICFHLQVVLCPGYNTGEVLEKTVRDLARLGPAAISLALVPVGLTAHCNNQTSLRRLESKEARTLLRQLALWQRFFLKTRGSRFVFAADEIHNLAGEPFPAAAAYEGFPQLENGIGLSRLFLDELDHLPDPPALPLPRPLRATLATGPEAAPLITKLARRFSALPGLSLHTEVVSNRFFGPQVTVAGLLTGEDLAAALTGKDLGECVFISTSLIREKDNLFLDGKTITELERRLQVTVRAVSGPKELSRALERMTAQPCLHI